MVGLREMAIFLQTPSFMWLDEVRVEVGHMTQVFLAHPNKAYSIISQREYIFQHES